MRASCYNTGNPFAAFRDLDRVLNGVWSKVEEGVNQAVNPDTPSRFAMDVYEDHDQLVVQADLPGFTKDQVAVTAEDGVLTVEATREATVNDESTVHLNERKLTHGKRQFKVPTAYDTTQVGAKLEQGVLTLTLPKREEKKPQTIEVK